jgi:hypothetical protein
MFLRRPEPSSILVLKSCEQSGNGREQARRTYDGAGVVRNEDVGDESESEGASKEFDE